MFLVSVSRVCACACVRACTRTPAGERLNLSAGEVAYSCEQTCIPYLSRHTRAVGEPMCCQQTVTRPNNVFPVFSKFSVFVRWCCDSPIPESTFGSGLRVPDLGTVVETIRFRLGRKL